MSFSFLQSYVESKEKSEWYLSTYVHIQIQIFTQFYLNFPHILKFSSIFPGGPQPLQQPPQQPQEPQNQRPPASNADVLAELISFD